MVPLYDILSDGEEKERERNQSAQMDSVFSRMARLQLFTFNTDVSDQRSHSGGNAC